MTWRWALLFFSFVLIAPALSSATCDGDGTCETGENGQLPPCFDCTAAYCGDSTCDTGLGEHLYGQSTYSQSDCGLPNGESCYSNGECLSNYCCGAPSGVCVAMIECNPGDTTACSTNPPRIKTCTSTCTWPASCTQDVECVENYQCDDNNVCTHEFCVDYQCENPNKQAGWQCQTYPEMRCNYYNPPACWELCVSPNKCLRSQPANTPPGSGSSDSFPIRTATIPGSRRRLATAEPFSTPIRDRRPSLPRIARHQGFANQATAPPLRGFAPWNRLATQGARREIKSCEKRASFSLLAFSKLHR